MTVTALLYTAETQTFLRELLLVRKDYFKSPHSVQHIQAT